MESGGQSELLSKQVENRKIFMVTTIVDGPKVESFDGARTKSQFAQVLDEVAVEDTGKSFSEALILTSVNPQYDK